MKSKSEVILKLLVEKLKESPQVVGAVAVAETKGSYASRINTKP